MPLPFRRRPEPAPVRLRLLAGTIDIGMAVATIALIAGTVFAAFRNTDPQAAIERYGKWLQGRRVKLLLQLADLVPRIVLRGRGTAGQRIAGVRVVDARTGAAPGVRAVLTLWAARAVVGKGLALLSRLSLRRVAAEREASQARLAELHVQGDTDRQKLIEAGTGLRNSCLVTLAFTVATTAAHALVIARSPRRQSLEQRLAGLIVARHRSR